MGNIKNKKYILCVYYIYITTVKNDVFTYNESVVVDINVVYSLFRLSRPCKNVQ